MQDLDTTIEKLKLLSQDNYEKAVGVINGLLSMQIVAPQAEEKAETVDVKEEEDILDDDLDALADNIFNQCTAAFRRLA